MPRRRAPHHSKRTTKAKANANRNALALIVIVIALIVAGILLFRSHAAQPAVALTASRGTVTTPAVSLTDSTATGGSAVQFQAGKPSGGRCGNPKTGNKIDTVIVVAAENHTWGSAGGVGFGTNLPYLHQLASECTIFSQDTEVDTGNNSATQYVGAWTGFGPSVTHVSGDCAPSPSCSYTGNNIFRNLRNAGIPHREFVETTSTGTCNATTAGNAAKHIPDLYMFDPTDKAACPNEVLPLSQFNWGNPPTGFTFITPTVCHEGHDPCDIPDTEKWESSVLPALFNSPQYKAGKVLVDLWWDEDHPRPNVFACWSCNKTVSSTDPHFYGESALWLNLVGAPTTNLGPISTAPDIRPIIGTP